MSLHNSDFTYFTLQEAGPAAFKSEVDRYVKEVDLFRSDAQTDERPRKRARYADSQSQESGYGSHPHPPQPPQTVSGVILEVDLVNFLSHEEFKITLNKRLNFIVGLNGSGKSAILTGIIVALGGTASMTGRGTSLKDFVKHNCQSARVTVVVNNTGSLNYYREQYGNKITVIRTIDNQGRSKVELRTEGGRTISTKMEDLRGMCLKLGIQVDNPVSVLDQSTAKTLLRENKPAELFHVFMKATDLETLRDLHDEIERLCRQTDQEIRKKKRDLQNNNAELVEIKRKYELVESLEEDKVKEDVLKLELLRAQARDSLMELREAQRALKNAETERLELEKLLSSDHESQTLLQALEDIKQEGMDLAIQREEMESNFKTLNTKVNDTTKELKRCGLDKEELETRIQHNNFMMGEFKNEIDSLEKKLQPCLLEEKKKMEEELSLLQQTLKQCENDQLAFKTKLQNLHESLSHSNDALVEIRGDERRLQKSLVEKERELQNLKTDSTNLSRFGGMKRLVELIEQNAGNFKRKPIGPLGAFVKVKDPKWILAVEAAIRPRINNFLLEHKEDEKLLQSLVRTVGGPKPGVVRCRFIPPINTSMREARTSNYSNVLDMIEVNDPNVRNALIEIFTVEGILLIPTDDECHNLLKDRRNVPKNCFKAITLKGSSYFPDPHYRTYGAIHDEARFLAVSQESIITGVSNTIARIQNELMEIKQKCSSATLEVQNTKKLIKEAKTADRTNSENLIEAKNKMEKLRDSENFDTHSIHTLKEDLAERMRRQTENNALLEKYNEKLQNLKKEQRELKRKGTEFQNKINELEKLRSPLITKQAKIKEKIEKINCFKTNSANKIKQIKNQEEQHACTFKKSEDAFNQRNQDAEKFASHLASDGRNLQEIPNTESSRNTKTIDDDLKRIMKKRASLEKSLGNNWHEISRSYHDTFAVHAGIQKKIETLQKNSLLLKEALESRQNLYLIQRKFTGCVVSHQFTRVLFQRNCIGNVKVNFEKKLLDINVGPIDQGDRAGLGTSSLSGGERSYATAAFVIALWIVTELPFYYLDEFDVFMDKVARQTVLNLLLKFARMKRGYQFGILTPQDTAAISQAADLTIFKLANPRDDI